MIRRPPRSTLSSSSAASDVYKRQSYYCCPCYTSYHFSSVHCLSLIHISEPTRRTPISYAVFCLKKNKNIHFLFFFFFFFNDTATTEIYTILFVGSVRCV